ncbi:MAG: DUF192 domain-containing protein [Bradymonadales bacterium]|nr:MAG: DUF192 domain-containing protein [Bradymonadales bacterium]
MLQADHQQILAGRVEVYSRPKDRRQGLLKFKTPPTDFAAIFVLPLWGFFPAVHTFGMKYPIHILYCDSDRKVRELRESVAPNRFILPWRKFFGGYRYLIELVEPKCLPELGSELSWKESAE